MATLGVGTRVQVRTGFDRTWATGFEVVDADGDSYLLRRLSDGRTLPRRFVAEDVRRERRADDLWWV